MTPASSRVTLLVLALLAAGVTYACGTSSDRSGFETGTPDAGETPPPPPPSLGVSDAGAGDARASCPSLPSPPTNSGIELAPAYAPVYSVYELGPVPGVPADEPLGGTVLLANTTDTLLVGAGSEQASGAIYEIKVKRDACDHIVAFDGVAQRRVSAPYVDATLVYGPAGVLLFPMWSSAGLHQIGQLAANATMPVVTSTQPLGIGGGGPGSAGFVPPSIAGAAGELRVLTQNAATADGYWYHVDYESAANGTLTLKPAQQRAVVPNWPGGFAYVPAGSPGFADQALIVAEWQGNAVAVYPVDGEGDPVVTSRSSFFTKFPRPWGAYFEPVTGDFLFLTWRASIAGQTGPDRLYVVSGFKPPPPPPAPK